MVGKTEGHCSGQLLFWLINVGIVLKLLSDFLNCHLYVKSCFNRTNVECLTKLGRCQQRKTEVLGERLEHVNCEQAKFKYVCQHSETLGHFRGLVFEHFAWLTTVRSSSHIEDILENSS